MTAALAATAVSAWGAGEIYANLGNRVWLDLNKDGIQDTDVNGFYTEPGVAGAQVELWVHDPCKGADEQVFVNGLGQALYPVGQDYVETDASGYYLFRNLVARYFDPNSYVNGRPTSYCVPEYYVLFRLTPALVNDGYEYTGANLGGDNFVDSDAVVEPNLVEAWTERVILPFDPSQPLEDLTLDAGLVLPGGDILLLLGDYVWLDRNCNGVQDGTESGVEGVTVNLYAAGDLNTVLASTETGPDGSYLFDSAVNPELVPGEYVVQFVLPGGYTFTTANAIPGDDEFDSDAGAGGYSHVVVVDGVNVTEDLTVDAGLCVEDSGICTRTIGYWKTHPEAWPVEEIEIGGVVYTKAQAIAIMKTPPAGNKVFNLFHQLVATKLNLLQGANAACIIDTVDAADAWLAVNGAGVVGGSDPAWVNGGGAMHTQLDEYNNGKLCAAHCDDGGGSPCPKPEPKPEPCPKPEPKPEPCPKPEPKPSCDWVKKWDGSKCWDAKKGWDWNKGWDWCKKSGGDKNWDKTSDCNTKSGGSKSKKSGGR